jgi:hypothetical protein
MEAALLEGLMQSNADCWLPSYQIIQKMKDLELDLNEKYPLRGEAEAGDEVLRIVAHPHQFSDSRLVPSPSLIETTNYGQRKRIGEMRQNEREDPDTLRYPHEIHLPLRSQSFSQWARSQSVKKGPAPRIVIAIGPDGGWTDDELYFFHINNFHFVSLGDRILRTDMAVSLLPLCLCLSLSLSLSVSLSLPNASLVLFPP